MEYNKRNLNGWALPEEAFEWIIKNIPHGSTIVELGSGSGTKELVKFYNVFSVEQNIEWVGKEPKTNYIYAPLKEGWYDESVFDKLPADYSFLLIDGPIGADRANFVKHCQRFKNDVPFLIDDTQRSIDKNMAIEVSKKLDRNVEEIVGHEKKFIILTIKSQ